MKRGGAAAPPPSPRHHRNPRSIFHSCSSLYLPARSNPNRRLQTHTPRHPRWKRRVTTGRRLRSRQKKKRVNILDAHARCMKGESRRWRRRWDFSRSIVVWTDAVRVEGQTIIYSLGKSESIDGAGCEKTDVLSLCVETQHLLSKKSHLLFSRQPFPIILRRVQRSSCSGQMFLKSHVRLWIL